MALSTAIVSSMKMIVPIMFYKYTVEYKIRQVIHIVLVIFLRDGGGNKRAKLDFYWNPRVPSSWRMQR